MPRRRWHTAVCRDEWSLRVEDVPWRGVVLQNVWEVVCAMTRGWAGGHNCPKVFWRIPMGKPKWDHSDPEDPWLENSLGNALWHLENKALLWGDRHATHIATIVITQDDARKINPEFVAVFDDDDDDDESEEATIDCS